jgi:hypothetical protein
MLMLQCCLPCSCGFALIPCLRAPILLVARGETRGWRRYGWLHVVGAGSFTVSGISVACQVRPINYYDRAFETGGPSSPSSAGDGASGLDSDGRVGADSDADVVPGAGAATLMDVWYSAVYTTRVDLLPPPDNFGR